MRRAPALLLGAGAVLLLAGCGASAGAGSPNWQASPPLAAQGPGAKASPIVPVPSGGNGADGTAPGQAPGSTPSSGKSTPKIDPLVVATRLHAPIGIAILPDNTALVGERTTGRIVQVQPRAGQPVRTIRTLPGVDAIGDGGLLDLALSPTYDQDGLVYAYITTRTDNRVVDFTLTGPVTPVLTGIPRGTIDNAGRIAFGADGDLYVGTGDAGNPALAADPHSLAGKVLRIDAIGDPAPGNPSRSSPIYARARHVVTGLCALPKTPALLEVEPDEVNALAAGTFGPPLAALPRGYGGPGGCALLDGRLWIASLSGRALLSAPLSGTGGVLSVGSFKHVLDGRYGRLANVVAAPDGALWLTTSNRDGHGRPVPADERVIRYLPASDGGGGSPL